MQRDLEFATLSDNELAEVHRMAQEKLGDQRGRSYLERQALALMWLRANVERGIREEERRLGLRHSSTASPYPYSRP